MNALSTSFASADEIRRQSHPAAALGDMAYYYYRADSTVGIAMDMVAPYGVYLNGRCVGEYDTEAAATAHYESLRKGLPHRAPVAEEAHA